MAKANARQNRQQNRQQRPAAQARPATPPRPAANRPAAQQPKPAAQPNKAARQATKQANRAARKAATIPGVKAGRQAKRALANEAAVQNWQQQQNLQAMNPNYNTPFGSQTVTYDEFGQPTVDWNLAPEQQQLYQSGTGLSQTGMNLAQQGLGNYEQFNRGSNDFRNEAFKTAYEMFSKNVARDYDRDRADLEQSLYNRGIQFSDDPNSRYQREMGALTEGRDTAMLDAQRRAFMESGSEAQRNYGMDLGSHQQNMADIGQLQGLGTGLQMPNFPGYQGAQVNVGSPTDISLALQEMKLKKQLAQKQLGSGGGEGGGGDQAPTANYSTAAYPGA